MQSIYKLGENLRTTWYWYLLSVILGLLVSKYYLSKTNPIYEIKSKITVAGSDTYTNNINANRIKSMHSLSMMQEIIEELSYAQSNTTQLDKLAEDFLYKLKIRQFSSEPSTLELSLKDDIPVRSIKILNALTEKYSNILSNDTTSDPDQSTIEFIDDLMSEVGEDLKNVKSDLEQASSKSSVSKPVTTTSVPNTYQYVERQKSLELQLYHINSIKMELNLTSNNFKQIPTNSTVLNAQLSNYIDQFNKLVVDQNIPDNKQNLTNLKSSILSSIDILVRKLNLEQDQLASQIVQPVTETPQPINRESELTAIARNQSITEELYEYLEQKKEKAKLVTCHIHLSMVWRNWIK